MLNRKDIPMLSRKDVLAYAAAQGTQSASDLLLLCGPDGYEGGDYHTLYELLECGDIDVSKAIHLHGEDDWNEYEVAYCGVIVGSELTGADFIIENIRRARRQG